MKKIDLLNPTSKKPDPQEGTKAREREDRAERFVWKDGDLEFPEEENAENGRN